MADDRYSELGFMGRDDLIADLAKAVEEGSPPSVLAVFELAGTEEYRRIHGEAAGEDLLAVLAEEFARAVRPPGRCYNSRQDEFLVLLPLPFTEAEPILAVAAIGIRREGEISLIDTSFGLAVLPNEASDPIAALMIADQHLAIARRGRERRASVREEGEN